MSQPIHVLIVDDEPFVRESLCELLRAQGLRATAALGVADALEQIVAIRVDVVVTDLSMPGGGGQALLVGARRNGIRVPVIVISGVGTIADAVAAMKAGAFDFLQKPVDPDQLLLVIRRAAEHHGLLTEVARLRDTVESLRPASALIGSSPEIQWIREAIAQVAPTDTTVFVRGESGTGKEVASDEIHRASSRASRPILRLNCAALPTELVESELFGHRKGAFTGALADRAGSFAEAEGGTLVLDEIGALNLGSQAKLLRVLESGEYQLVGESRVRKADVRVIAITNEDLAEKAKSGAFRGDLFYRLNVFPIAMPPLRQHKQDIAELAAHFLARPRGGGPPLARAAPPRIAPDALEVLHSYEWPGNVRELRNVLERAAIVAAGTELDAALFRGILESALSAPRSAASAEFHLRRNLDAAERKLLLDALAFTRNQRKEASHLLGIDPRNLSYYMRKHGITDDDLREPRG